MGDNSNISRKRYSRMLFGENSNQSTSASKTNTLRNMLKKTINLANNKLYNLYHNKQIKKEKEARETITKALLTMANRKRYGKILDDLEKDRNELSKKNSEEINIVKFCLKRLEEIKKDLDNGLLTASEGLLANIKRITYIVENTNHNNSIVNRSRENSDRVNSDRVNRSRENSDRVNRSRENSSKTSVTIDRSELMMKNLKTIFKYLSDIWSDYIIYDDRNNTDGIYKLKIKLPGSSYDISYRNITELANNFKKYYSTISFACYFPCSKDIKELIYKLNNSNDEKNSYDIIIELLKQYIKENIEKPGHATSLIRLQEVIKGLKTIKGGKLPKVRKTNVIKKRAARVIIKL
jgi:hypothetical protein